MKNYTLFLVLLSFPFLLFGQKHHDLSVLKKGMLLKASKKQRSFSIQKKKNNLKSTSIPLFQEDFESSTNFTTSGDWQIGSPSVGPGSGYNTSPNCAGTKLDTTYSNTSFSELISPSIQLPNLASTADRIALIFYEWFEMESGYDIGEVDISTDGGNTWITLDTRDGQSSGWFENIIYLDTYAGENIKLRFLFTSDSNLTYNGWYVDNISIEYVEESWLTSNITSIDAQNFPFLYLNVTVDTSAVPLGTLTQSNFTVYEDGQLQTDYFKVYPPKEGTGSRIADIVFIMDNSGSLSDEQAAVEANVTNFVNQLDSSGIDYTLGLCRYGQSLNSGTPTIEDNGNLTNSISYFLNTLWARNVVNGGTEPAYDAIYASAYSFNFRPGAQKIFIIITDENPDQGVRTYVDARTALQANSITLYALTDPNEGGGLSTDLNPLAVETNGRYYDIADPFNDILSDIGLNISNKYLIRYSSSNNIFDAQSREVRVEVNYDNNTSNAYAYYTPGEVPVIIKTPATLTLESEAQLQGNALDIAIMVSDQFEPFVNDVKIYFKNTTDSVYAEAAMQNVSDSTWSYTIPGISANTPGVDYYIVARDSFNTVSEPRTFPAENPNQIAILPNVKPKIIHTPISEYENELALDFICEVIDTTNNVDSVKLYIRLVGDLIYESYNMSFSGNNTYEYSFSIPPGSNEDYEYYIKAWDNYSVKNTAGSPVNPFKIYYQGACLQHFHPVWEGTAGLDHMNINVFDAKLDALDLAPGDEIGIFDDTLCVGYGKVEQTIDMQNILSITVSRDDGTNNGFTIGNEISYVIWDCTESAEFNVQGAQYYNTQLNPISPRFFESGGTAFVTLSAESEICLSLYFNAGWNIFSSNNSPDSSNMQYIFQPLIDDGSLVKIQDEFGNSLEDWGVFGGWQNSIDNLFTTEGYKIKVNFDDSIQICGAPVELPFSIPLSTGWNIMGYPQTSAFDGMEVVQPLIDNSSLVKVQDEFGNSIEDWGVFGGWQNNIGSFVPGEGYKIKLSTNDTLQILDSYSKSSSVLKQTVKTNHFQPAFDGYGVDHMNVNLVKLPVHLLQQGDEIAVFDGETCVGAVSLLNSHLKNRVVSVAASASDGQGIQGFTEGNMYLLKLWKAGLNKEIELSPEIRKGPDRFTKHESAFLSLEKYAVAGFDGIDLNFANSIRCYPNPFNDEVTLELKLIENSEVQIEVINQLGQSINNIVGSKHLIKGIHRFTWNGKNHNNQKVSPGIYHLKYDINDKVNFYKIMFSE